MSGGASHPVGGASHPTADASHPADGAGHPAGDRSSREGAARLLAARTAPRFLEAVEAVGAARDPEAERGAESADPPLVFDAAQRAAIAALAAPADGLYLWGPVGRGKSRIAQLYFDAVPTAAKRRVHFHGFLRELHATVFARRLPIDRALDEMLAGCRAVMFDEFHVHDVADAHYLARLLDALERLDVLLIATSNYAPRALMPNPLFHDAFAPGIRLIEARCSVVEIGEGPDYRLRGARTDAASGGFAAGTWRVERGPGSAAGIGLERRGASADDRIRSERGLDPELELGGLRVRATSLEAETAVFAFAQLCEEPLGAHQYLDLAERFDRVEVVAVPDPATLHLQTLGRLCALVDVFADRDTTLSFVAAAPWNHIAEAPLVPEDVARAMSRLALLGEREG